MSAPRATVTGSVKAMQRNEGPSHLPLPGIVCPVKNGSLVISCTGTASVVPALIIVAGGVATRSCICLWRGG
jgi:hypothetical protein